MKTSHTGRLRCGMAMAMGLLAAAPAWSACALTQLEMPVRIVNQRPVGTLTLNGTEVPMLIDSGAFFSMLAPGTAAQLGLPLERLPDGFHVSGYTGRVEAKLTRVASVGLRGSEIKGVQFIVGGNELGSGIMGVLGRNFLSIADTEYDLAHGVVRLMFPKGDCDDANLVYWAGDAPVIETELDNSFRGGATDIRVSVRVNGARMTAIMDTGAPQTALKLRAARRAGLKESDLTEIGRVGGAGAGRVRSWTGRIAAFELGGEKIANNLFQIDDTGHLDADMLIGLDYFLSHRIYVSRLQRKVYATWNGGPVFARGDAVGVYDSRFAAVPEAVAAGDAEALARRGEASAARGEMQRALDDLNRACELAPTSAANFLARARVHLAMKQPRQAQGDLDEALRLQPALHEAMALRVSLRLAGGDRSGALADLRALDAALAPASHLRAGMAHAFAELALVPNALRQWELWMPSRRADARLAHELNNRCWLRTRLDLDLKLALEDCQEAVRRDGAEPAYRDSLGWTLLRLGDAAAAVKSFDAALALKPLAIALYGRALAHQRLGDAPAARRDLAAARKAQAGIDDEVRQQGLPVIEAMPEPDGAAATPSASPS